MGGIRVEPFDLDADGQVAAIGTVRRATDALVDPEDPPVTDAEIDGELRHPSAKVDRRVWLAFVDDEPAGVLDCEMELAEENAALADTNSFAVAPAFRRQGVATALLRTALPWLLDRGRTSFLTWTSSVDGEGGAALAGRLGLTARTSERCSRVRVADLDQALLDDWVATGRRRDDGYRLVQFQGECPEEHLDAYTAAYWAMSDMPLDDLEWHVTPLTPADVRAREDRWRRRGTHPVQTLALAPDGTGAGLSELFGRGHRPQIADQGDTGVVAEHRGRGLGRWMKAENLLAARAAIPEMAVVETYNAETNPWMLDINVAMGFRPHVGWTGYQGDIETALAALG